MRAADADRERTAERLRDAAVEGRLCSDELEQRLEAALSATTYSELDRLVADLPAPAPPRARRSRTRLPVTCLAVSAMLVIIWALTGAGYFWPVWPILGWGLCAGPRLARVGFRACHPSASSTS
jgi:fatty acid desaturase